MRWGPGPVFVYECLVNSRRWQTYALRSVGVAALLCAMGTIATSDLATTRRSWRNYANLGQAYFIALIGVELALVMLAAPAATAGAICLDRARGTLAHMLMTDLSDPEVVLGKLAARVLPVLGLVACTWPVMAISSLLGGIDPIALTLAFAIIVAVAVFGCTMALALSVWARKSHEVILATYTVFIAGLLLWPVWNMLMMAGQVGPPPPWTILANPFYVAFAPYADPDKLDLWSYLVFFGAALASSTLMIVVAVWWTRAVACRGSVESSKRPRIALFARLKRWLPGPSLDRNPVLWRECHRTRPSRWMTAIIALLMGTTGALCITGSIAFWKNGVDFRSGAIWQIFGVCSYLLHIIFGLLMLAAISPTSMAEERQGGSLDLLAATALSTRDIVIGKWLGTFRLVWPISIGPGLLALAMATARSSPLAIGRGFPPDYYRRFTLGARCYGVILVVATILAHGALITSVGLALAVWIKRQSRAIAMSVGWYILVTAVWPIVASMTMFDGRRRTVTLTSLSPVAICGDLVTMLTRQTHAFGNGTLWSGTFWAVEVLVPALALLWLTVRTFDGCFDRIPDRPWQLSVRTAAILVLAGLIDIGCLMGAVGCWVEGVDPEPNRALFSVILAFSLLIAIGLLLVGAEAALPGKATGLDPPDAGTSVAVRRFVVGRWRRSFCLVLLLAIGPALLALALATAHRARHYDPQVSKNAQGVNVVTYVLRTDWPCTGEVLLDERLMLTAVLFATILANGGAAVSVGLALATVSEWSRRAIVGVVAIAVLAALVLPVCFFMLNGGRPLDSAAGSFAMAMSSLLGSLVTRRSLTFDETILSVAAWDLATAIFAVALSAWTIKFLQMRASRAAKIKRLKAPELGDSQPAVEAG